MSINNLEDAVRAALRHHVSSVDAGSLTRPDLVSLVAAPRRRQQWVAPLLAAVLVLAIADVVGGLTISRTDRRGDPVMSTHSEDLDGSWQLRSVRVDDRAIDVPLRPAVVLTFGDRSLVIRDGINTRDVDVDRSADALSARLRSITYVLDPREGEAAGRILLQVLDSVAPGSSPNRAARSTYRVEDDELVLRAPGGELTLDRLPADPTGNPGDGVTSTTPAAPTSR